MLSTNFKIIVNITVVSELNHIHFESHGKNSGLAMVKELTVHMLTHNMTTVMIYIVGRISYFLIRYEVAAKINLVEQ